MLSKFCNKLGCTAIISQGERYCIAHRLEAAARHRDYDASKRDKRLQAFYRSSSWLRIREQVMAMYNYIDLFEYYEYGRIAVAHTLHHIIEIQEDWDKRLSVANLFPVGVSNHNTIHNLYKKDKEATQSRLMGMLEMYRNEFGRS